jgi:hypothetical protein
LVAGDGFKDCVNGSLCVAVVGLSLWAWAAAIPDLPLGAQKYIEESNAMTPHKSDLSRVLNILLIDDLPVRRSGVARLIEGWAQEDGIAIRTSDLALPTNDPDYDFDLALLSIGGTDASSPKGTCSSPMLVWPVGAHLRGT